MQRISSEERMATASANSSPRMPQKTSNSLFGLLTKRSTKVEPHPIKENSPKHHNRSVSASGINAVKKLDHDIKFAKCTPDRQLPQMNNHHHNHNHQNHSQTNTSSSSSSSLKQKSSTLPAVANATKTIKVTTSTTTTPLAYKIEKAHNSAIISNVPRKYKQVRSKTNRTSTEDGSQSDGGNVVLRRTPKHRSPNHNRFSHQFSLCCRADKKSMTPPVSVRYNSFADCNNSFRRDNVSESWCNADNASLSLNSYDVSQLPALAALSQTNVTASECASAPESPVTAKSSFIQQQNAPSSPSNSSAQSIQCDSQHYARASNEGPIRPIAVSACRSRLRLKLYPPGKELPLLNDGGANEPSSIKKATTPQHMSSPNISTQPDFDDDAIAEHEKSVRFISHENIQMQRQSNNYGLATQALMGAQMLSLIPTEKARERGFLSGNLGSSSLLGPSELSRILPTKEVTIFVGTWNMNGQSPPKQMNDFVLPANIEHVPDIVVIGTQESSPDRFEWEVTIQETLGPSHVLFHSTTLGTLHLAVYMRRDLIWYCSAPEDASFSVRTGTAFRTKGAVAISFCLFGTSMLFVTSHLTAHQQKVKERVSDVKRIIHALDLPRNLNVRHKCKDVTQNFDNVFWCGDLNFRLSEPRENLLEWIQNTKFPLPAHLPHGYMHTDQLQSVLSDGAAFRGFMEANITFPPTYKYDPGTQHFDTSSKQRAPAYTDRILYKYRQTQGFPFRRQSIIPGAGSTTSEPFLECLLYDSVPSIITSDHKPVWALFKAQIRAGTDSIPLAAGLFNREIYLEGMKRRLHNKYSGSSAVCAIQ